MLGYSKLSDLYDLSKNILENNLTDLISKLETMYQRGSETSKILEDLMNIINWSCKLKINSNLIKDEFLTEDDIPMPSVFVIDEVSISGLAHSSTKPRKEYLNAWAMLCACCGIHCRPLQNSAPCLFICRLPSCCRAVHRRWPWGRHDHRALGLCGCGTDS